MKMLLGAAARGRPGLRSTQASSESWRSTRRHSDGKPHPEALARGGQPRDSVSPPWPQSTSPWSGEAASRSAGSARDLESQPPPRPQSTSLGSHRLWREQPDPLGKAAPMHGGGVRSARLSGRARVAAEVWRLRRSRRCSATRAAEGGPASEATSSTLHASAGSRSSLIAPGIKGVARAGPPAAWPPKPSAKR